jgi:hypothetical protein
MKITPYEIRFKDTLEDYSDTGFDFPEVREAEFRAFRQIADIDFSSILEFPADGQYLNSVYPFSTITRAELLPAKYSKYLTPPKITTFSLSGLERNHFNGILCITPIHHAESKSVLDFLIGAYECLKCDGTFVIGEVFSNSKVAYFLDDFIDKHSKNGHKGNYPDNSLLRSMRDIGLKNVGAEVINCPWGFNSEIQLLDFVTKIFGLKKMSPEFLINHLDSLLGLSQCDGKIYLDWELMYFKGNK